MAARNRIHWTQTPEGRKKQSRRMKAQHRNGGLKKHAAEVVAHIEPKAKASAMLYDVKIKGQGATTGFELLDVPRADVLAFIGRLMKGK